MVTRIICVNVSSDDVIHTTSSKGHPDSQDIWDDETGRGDLSAHFLSSTLDRYFATGSMLETA